MTDRMNPADVLNVIRGKVLLMRRALLGLRGEIDQAEIDALIAAADDAVYCCDIGLAQSGALNLWRNVPAGFAGLLEPGPGADDEVH